MAKTLGPIRYTAPPSGGEDFRGVTQGLDALSGLIQTAHISNVTGDALEEVDTAVKGSLATADATPTDLSGIKPADELSALAFASQYQRLQNIINNTSGSVRTKAIMEAKRAIQDRIDSHPSLRTQLVREFNAYMSSSPALAQAAQIDEATAQDTRAQDHLERIGAVSYLDWDKGGYGIREDIPVGSLRWAKEFKEQAAKRAEYDSVVEQVAIRKAQGQLKGPEAVAAAHELLNSASGQVQGLMRDFGNRLSAIETNRVEGKLVPADQEAWEATKPALIREISASILKIGEGANQVLLSDPAIISDTTTYDAITRAIDTAQADLTAALNAIKNDDFDIIQQMKSHSYLRGTRIIGQVPLLQNMADTMQVEGSLYTALNDAGITNALKASQVAFEEPLAAAGEQFYGALMNSTNDGATTTATNEEEYRAEKNAGERKVRLDRAESHPARVREAKDTVDTLITGLRTIKTISPIQASEGLAVLASQWKTLNESKSFIFDGNDKAKIRETAANPELERLALAAVNHNLPGLRLESEQFETYWRSTSDSEDLDSFEAWHTELAEQTKDTVPSVPYITNIMEVVRPLEFQKIQNDGEIHLVVNEKKIEAAVREDLKRRGITEASLPSETAIAVGFAKKRAAIVSAEATKFLRVRSTRNIMANRLKKPDYLDAFFDPITGLDKIFTLDEDIVPK